MKGLGCDCIHFVARVLEEMGVLKWRKDLIPDYPPDWHIHNTRSLLIERAEKEFNVEHVGFDSPMNGDIMVYHFGKTAAHAGFYFDGLLYQAITDIGVQMVPWYDKNWFSKKRHNLRLLNIKEK